MLALPFYGQTATEEFAVYAEHPRLLLKPQRIRLLKRERERQSARWEHLHTLVSGGAQFPEPGFASALHYQVSGDETSGRKAVQWALGPGASDVRQIAIVFDWCQGLLTEAQSRQLVAKLGAGLAATSGTDLPSLRARIFAAVVVAGHGLAPKATLEKMIREQWRREIAPGLEKGTRTLAHADIYTLFELMHVVRDNTQIDLRDDAPGFFKKLPSERLLSYYPASYPAPENDYRIPYYAGASAPDLRIAAMTRAAEFAMVAYDTNAVESQFLQGWLLHDRFQLKSSWGAAYEFLWANPYQPGLSFQHMPLRFHDERTGRLLIRSSWEEDAMWAAYVQNRLQVFRDGKIQSAAIKPGEPFVVGETAIAAGPAPLRLRREADGAAHWFLVGLTPFKRYDLEVDDEELSEVRSDRGGVVALPPFRTGSFGFLLHEGLLPSRP